MSEKVIAQKEPFSVQVQQGKKYAWCACGRSQKQPYCDGSHSGTVYVPVLFQADKDETVYLCGCKHTAQSPFCDGTHQTL